MAKISEPKMTLSEPKNKKVCVQKHKAQNKLGFLTEVMYFPRIDQVLSMAGHGPAMYDYYVHHLASCGLLFTMVGYTMGQNGWTEDGGAIYRRNPQTDRALTRWQQELLL